jgi:hypothetical protein
MGATAVIIGIAQQKIKRTECATSRLRCVEVAVTGRVAWGASEGFPAAKADSDGSLALADIFWDFSTRRILSRGFIALYNGDRRKKGGSGCTLP